MKIKLIYWGILFVLLTWTSWAAIEIPPRFDGMRYRVINGKVYDFAKPIIWANVYMHLKPPPPSAYGHYPASGLERMGATITSPTSSSAQKEKEEKEKMWKQVQSLESKYKSMLIVGRVTQILPAGLLVQIEDDSIILLKNHPKAGTLVDGAAIEVLAMSVGNFQYLKTNGANATVKAYDHGAIAPRKDQKMPAVRMLE